MGIIGIAADLGRAVLPEVEKGAENAASSDLGSLAQNTVSQLLGGGGEGGVLGDVLSALTGGGGGNSGPTAGNSSPGGTSNSNPSDLVAAGASLQQGDVQTALSDLNNSDPAAFQKLEADLSKGDGNSAVQDLVNDVNSGALSKSDAAAIGSDVQQTANAHGGGKINGTESNALENTLGENVLAKGETRGEIGAQNFFGALGNMVKSVV
jgi:hypothetical protein